jgi:hypothetical protein
VLGCVAVHVLSIPTRLEYPSPPQQVIPEAPTTTIHSLWINLWINKLSTACG